MQTRSMARREEEFLRTFMSEMIPSLSQLSSSQGSISDLIPSQVSSHGIPERIPMYRPNDRHKKHRLPDDQPYTQTVKTHKRRTPF